MHHAARFARDFVSRTAFRNARASTKEQGTLGKIFRRFFTTKEEDKAVKVAKNATQGSSASRLQKNKNVALYAAAGAIAAIGLSYGAVPLYRLFCESTATVVPEVKPVRELTVHFSSHVSETLPWSFVPVQKSIEVLPGETALAFYQATNHTDKPIIGVSTYNVVPMRVGLYFTKIQCFCFEEQRLNPGETVNMPVLFYIHPDILDDPQTTNIEDVTLSYTFFMANDQNAHLDEYEAEINKEKDELAAASG